jgi:hypothetical protein
VGIHSFNSFLSYPGNDVVRTDDRGERAAVIEYDGVAPREWAEALARLDPERPLADVPPLRWLRFLDDARQFLASAWPRQAAELGWSALDLFGCHSVAPYARHDCKGLIWSLGECGGGRLVAVTADTAVIERPTGSRQSWPRRPPDPDAVLPWEARDEFATSMKLTSGRRSRSDLRVLQIDRRALLAAGGTAVRRRRTFRRPPG